jgi:hypothetical protein
VLQQYGLTTGVQARTINFLWERLSDSGSQTGCTVLAASAPCEISVDERRRAMVAIRYGGRGMYSKGVMDDIIVYPKQAVVPALK